MKPLRDLRRWRLRSVDDGGGTPGVNQQASPAFDAIGFDADDTLWHDISNYMQAKTAYLEFLAKYSSAEEIDSELDRTEARNLKCFGYGVKGFTLSMIETAITMTREQITAAEINQIISMGKDWLHSPVTPLPGVEPTISALSARYRLVVITKGDLFDQESKLARSGLGDFFDDLHVVSEKTPETYTRVLGSLGVEARRFLMVGNSLRSDILPVLELGGWAIHVPHEITWSMEMVSKAQLENMHHASAKTISDVPHIIEALIRDGGASTRNSKEEL